MKMKIVLVMIRHGQSLWNLENRFTGWTDVPLSEKGVAEAVQAGQVLKQEGYTFDVAYTSVLKRAIKTLWIVLEETGLEWIPVLNAWQLNERHYGALQGLNKSETALKFGEAQVKIWRRGYDVCPPGLEWDDPRHPRFDSRYASLARKMLPSAESLKMTLERVVPYWNDVLAPEIRAERRVLVSAHGNSMRALVKHLEGISDDEISELNIPTGIPLVYELDLDLHPLRRFYLADEEEVRKAIDDVAAQGKVK